MHRQKGFTLVEILFVLVIIAGVMAYAVPAYKRTQARAAYDAATGTLVDIGSSILAMKRDLAMQNYTYNFPGVSSRSREMGTASIALGPAGKTLKEYISGATDKDVAFDRALYDFGYLEPFSATGYKYYAVRSGNSTCNSKCTDAGVVACMCKSSYSATDCYYGAKFLNTGTVKRMEGDNCRS